MKRRIQWSNATHVRTLQEPSLSPIAQRSHGPMVKAPAYGAGDSRFESWCDRSFFLFLCSPYQNSSETAEETVGIKITPTIFFQPSNKQSSSLRYQAVHCETIVRTISAKYCFESEKMRSIETSLFTERVFYSWNPASIDLFSWRVSIIHIPARLWLWSSRCNPARLKKTHCIHCRSHGPMVKAPAYGAGDSRFESWCDRSFFPFLFLSLLRIATKEKTKNMRWRIFAPFSTRILEGGQSKMSVWTSFRPFSFDRHMNYASSWNFMLFN